MINNLKYSELIYSKCRAIEFDKAGIQYKREMEWPVYYDETIAAKRRIDFTVEDKVAVEAKALHQRSNKELTQGLNCLEPHKIETGLLINFGEKSLRVQRLINEQELLNEKNPVNPIPNPGNPRL